MSELRKLVAETIHFENEACVQNWSEMEESGEECGCFPIADAVCKNLDKAEAQPGRLSALDPAAIAAKVKP